MATPKRVIEFEFNCRKMVEAVLYVVGNMYGGINQYNLLQVIFYADTFHLYEYSRTITGCKYQHMPFGPVPITIYEMLHGKRLKFYLKELGVDKLPFHIEHEGKNCIVHADRKANLDLLSQTDRDFLLCSISVYGRLDPKEIKKDNHQKEYWLKSKPGEIIPFELMIDDEKLLEYLLKSPSAISIWNIKTLH